MGGDGFFLMAMAWVAVAAILFLMRPSSLRNRGDEKNPRDNNPNGGGGRPDQDPPAVM